MPDEFNVCISGVGVCTSLGGLDDACAASRAGLNRFSVHEHMSVMFPGEEEASPLTISPAATNLSSYFGVAKTVKLFKSAYQDLLVNLKSNIPLEGLSVLMAMSDPQERGLELDAPEDATREKRLQIYTEQVLEPLFASTEPELKKAPTQMVFGDRVSFARILKKALVLLGSGKSNHCLLMIADSFLNDETLDELLGEERLKTSENPVGFIPGEGAALILLSAASEVSETASLVSMVVEMDASVEEPEEDDTESDEDLPPEPPQHWREKKLENLIDKLQLPYKDSNATFPQFILDINGEEGRALEFGLLQVAMRKRFPGVKYLDELVPALSFGEVGSLMGPFGLCLALVAVRRGYARHSDFIMCLSDESGKRAVIKLQFNKGNN